MHTLQDTLDNSLEDASDADKEFKSKISEFNTKIINEIKQKDELFEKWTEHSQTITDWEVNIIKKTIFKKCRLHCRTTKIIRHILGNV